MATSLTQHGVTWNFDADYTTGQYANGDYYVVGPVTIETISPECVYDAGTGGYRNGAMINPPGGLANQGFDGRQTYGYTHALNVAFGVDAGDPLVITAGNSLVSSVGRDTEETSNNRWVEEYAILTVVSTPPASESFRPPYTDVSKTMTYTWADVDTSKLLNLTTVSGTPTWAEAESRVLKPLMMHGGGTSFWATQQLATGASDELPGYGREITRDAATFALMVNINDTVSNKKDTIIGLIQRGIDDFGLYTAVVDNSRAWIWPPNGGIFAGHKLPIVFAGRMLDDTDMWNYGEDQTDLNHEDAQTFIVGDTEIDRAYGDYTWDSRDVASGEVQAYTEAMRDMPEWGIRHTTSPTSDNAYWTCYYRETNGRATPEYFFAALVNRLGVKWNHDPSFHWGHRWMSLMAGDGDPFGHTVDGQPSTPQADRGDWDADWAGAGTWITDMFDEYWTDYYPSGLSEASESVHIVFTI